MHVSRDVLVAMDASETSDAALEYAFERFLGATIHVVHVTSRNDPYDLFGTPEPEEYVVAACDSRLDDEVAPDGNSFNRVQRKRAERVVDRACSLSEAYGTDIEPVVRSGDAVDEILACADERDVDEIVIGDHRRTELGPLVRGVPESVAREAGHPVTIVG